MSETETIPTSSNGKTELAVSRQSEMGMNSLLRNQDSFAHAQRVAKMFAASDLIPQHMRGKVADVTIVMAMAYELGENPLFLMQQIYIVNGKAGWSASYMIGRANRSGKFKGGIKWRSKGEGDDYVVTAYAKLADTGEEISIDASMKMAIAEEWTRNKKYKSMPQLMLRYRSATMLIRLYAPEVMIGRTDDEVYDIAGAVSEEQTAPTGSLSDIIDEPETAPTSDGADVVIDADESQKPANDIPDEMVTTPEAYTKAMESIAIEQGVDIEAFEACLGKIRTSGIRVGASRLQDAMAARRQVITAARSGKLDWKEGKISE